MMQSSVHTIPIYILHVRQGYEDRERFMKQQLDSFTMPFNWILEHDLPDLKEEQIRRMFTGEMYGIRPEVSCAMKHIEAWKRIATSDEKGGLILEDDMLLNKEFPVWMNKFLSEMDAKNQFSDPMLVSLENSTLMFVPRSERKEGQFLYKADRLRCAGAYYLTREGAGFLLNELQKGPVEKPIDWWMGERKDLIIYWSHPTIAEQGSHNGMFASSLDHKPKGIIRRIGFTVQRWVKSLKADRS
ncbi:MAG TPA: lipooligosaccharide biosynthesis protein LpsA [Flavobacteriales bacterium]|nr:lipooligosaccharide biosynthesis protein LpsA [Flavobacteriales bacterium]